VHHNPNECTYTVAYSHAYSVADGSSFVGPHVVTHDTAVCRTHIITHGIANCGTKCIAKCVAYSTPNSVPFRGSHACADRCSNK
jgi:hypothetical protein